MNRTYENCKLLITAGRYTYEDMFNKLDLFLMMGLSPRLSTSS